MLNEIFWKDGFIFYLQKKTKEKDCLLVQMNLIETKENEQKFQHTMQIKISSNDEPEQLFQTINRSFKEFSSKWIVSNILGEINFTITKTKKTIKTEKHIPLLHSSSSFLSQKVVAVCAYCFFPILIIISKENGKVENDLCENCLSKHFLLENQFAFIEVIAQGGFGRIFKALHLKTNSFVAIKERKKDLQPFIKVNFF
jgi:hypothetical protein